MTRVNVDSPNPAVSELGSETRDPIIVVGSGPAGVRVVQELQKAGIKRPILIYNEERHEPYNRVRLSGLLSGQHQLNELSLTGNLQSSSDTRVVRIANRVTSIDRDNRTVSDASGHTHSYEKLVLATGSRPFVPNIAGNALNGVFTFRDMADAEQLAARRTLSKHTLVVGAGLLGIEAACAMQRHNTKVSLIDHNPYPMFRQLDQFAGEILADELRERSIELLMHNGLRMIVGTSRVEGVVLRDGTEIACDTVVLATGIRPNIDLARQAGIAFGRGITVDATMQTSDPRVFAIGECCELAGEVFGLVAPGYEQASIAARNIANDGLVESYRSRQLATSLKVAALPVFSLGQAHPSAGAVTVRWRDAKNYRRISLVGGRLVGINAIGDWSELPQLREAASRRHWVSPWHLWRFQRSGKLFAEASSHVSQWPSEAIVCNCNSVPAGALRECVADGATSLSQLTKRTQAGSSCGSCEPLLLELLGTQAVPKPVKGARLLSSLVVPSVIVMLLATFASIAYPSTVQLRWDWGDLWRVNDYKQLSGFTILGLSLASVVFSFRKRLNTIRFGDFAWWRLAHVVVTVLAIAALAVHSGFRFGDNLNSWLSITFTALLIAGALLGTAISMEHRLSPTTARQLRTTGLWAHVFLSWPIPALLGVHVLKTYYF